MYQFDRIYRTRYYDDYDDSKSPSPSPSEVKRKIENLNNDGKSRLLLLLLICFTLAIATGIYIITRETVTVTSDFLEKIPEPYVAKLVREENSLPMQELKKEGNAPLQNQYSRNTQAGGGNPRTRVAQKGVLGSISGGIKGKSVAQADIFGKGGFASDIDAILAGVGGLKSGGNGGVGRKGVAGIGYGAGYGSGFGGGLSMERLIPGQRSSNPQFIDAHNTEGYSVINENSFLDVTSNPLSTFSIDVDAASYSNVRRYIEYGQLPPKDAVRIEELINYFTYDYPQPHSDDPFSLNIELAGCPWNKTHQLALVGIQGKSIHTDELPPGNLVFLIDVSGSMNSPNKLPLVKESLRLLVNQLRHQDMISIAVYAGAAGLVLPPTTGDNKTRIIDCINHLEAGGSTAGGEGIVLAYQAAQQNFLKKGNNRVILATDGDFNVGVSSDAELVRLIEDKRKSGIFLTVLGFGTGNYKDSKMEQLADKGNGNYAYIDNISEARKVLVEQMSGTLLTIAKDVKIQVEFNPAHVSSYRLIGYENRMMRKEEFNDDKKDAGELGAGHSVTALYELIMKDNENQESNTDSLRYQQTIIRPQAKITDEIMMVKLRYKAPESQTSRLITTNVNHSGIRRDMPPNLQFASAVAAFGMILRDSEFKGSTNLDQVIQLVSDAAGSDPNGYRKGFVDMVEKCRVIMQNGL